MRVGPAPVVLFCLLVSNPAFGAGDVAFERANGTLRVVLRGETVATYVTTDRNIHRPFFANVRAPGGAVVTRPHPPRAGDGPADHADMHPGIWLAFGDLAGADFWRNKGTVVHERFSAGPHDPGTFAVENRYDAGGRTICRETARYTVVPRAEAFLLIVDSTFQPNDADFAFGDQEEMGLGVRLAAPLSVKGGGRLTDGEGRSGEAGVWGKQADWCLAEGEAGGRRVGVMVMPDPKNFRRSWFHARDYGLVVANPFGRKAFTRGEESRVTVKKGESLRLRFGVLVFAGEKGKEFDARGHYAAFLAALEPPTERRE